MGWRKRNHICKIKEKENGNDRRQRTFEILTKILHIYTLSQLTEHFNGFFFIKKVIYEKKSNTCSL